MVRTQLVALLACLHCENRIVRSESTEQEAVKELARNIAKIISPVVTTDERDDDQSKDAGKCPICSKPCHYCETLLTVFYSSQPGSNHQAVPGDLQHGY